MLCIETIRKVNMSQVALSLAIVTKMAAHALCEIQQDCYLQHERTLFNVEISNRSQINIKFQLVQIL